MIFKLSKAVLDTSVLYDALKFNYVNIKQGNSNFITDKIHQYYKGFESGKSSYEYYLQYTVKDYYTSSHAIGELNGLFSRDKLIKDERNFPEFLRKSIEYLSNKGLQEELIKINTYKNLPVDRYKIGHVDYGIIKLARKLHLPVLTNDDRTLAYMARNLGVEVFVPYHYFHLPN